MSTTSLIADGQPAGGVTGRAPRGRASWSGLLRFSLVAVPIKAYPAHTASDAISFNQLHAGCGERIRYQKHCPVHGQVDGEEIAKGYQYAPDQYIIVESSELDQLRPAKEKALALEQFVDPQQIDPVVFSGRTLYLVPDGLPAQRPYLVLAQAMQQRGKGALGRITMSEHRQLVLVRPAGRLLSMHVLHYPEQLRASNSWEADLQNGAVSQEELQLAGMLIDTASGQVDWSRYRDDTAEKLSALIEAKIAGRPLAAAAEEPMHVLQLMDALKQSVAAACGEPAAAGPKTRPGRKSNQRRSA